MAFTNQTGNTKNYEQLSFPEIIGLIQLLTDINILDEEQRKGFYIKTKDSRVEALPIFEKLTNQDLQKLVTFLKKTSYID